MSDLVKRLRSPATVFYEYDADQGAFLREAAARIEALEKLDREAATHVESLICMKTHFTGDPPYIGWRGLGLALREHLERQASRIEVLEAEVAELKSNSITIAGNRSDLHPTATASLLEKKGLDQ